MNENVPRGHHYVWQYYLSAWEIGGKVWWNRKGNIQNTNTRKILKQRDMYKIYKLNELEKFILEKIWMDDNRKQLKKILENELRMLEVFDVFEDEKPSKIIEKLITKYGMTISKDGKEIDYQDFIRQFKGKEKQKHEIIKEIKKLRIELGEKLLSDDEKTGRKYLDMLRNDDISFFYNNKNNLDFYIYLNSQYLRTRKIRDRLIKNVNSFVPKIKKALKTNLEVDGKKIYSHGLHGLILKISVGMFQDKGYKIMMLKSKGETFITSDQPVMNMSEILLEDGTHEKMEYLMAICSQRAIIIKKSDNKNMIVETNDETVKYLNTIINKNSYEVIVGIDKTSVMKGKSSQSKRKKQLLNLIKEDDNE